MQATRAASIITGAALSILAGCSGASQPANPAIVSSVFQSPVGRPARRPLHDLYVADYGLGAIDVLSNDDYKLESRITAGISGPEADVLDAAGNLYVANAATADITEYALGTSSPSFTYRSGMIFPVNVAVDRKGNVFEADYGNLDERNIGFVNEYAQGSDAVLHACPTPGRTAGLAVDGAGDFFMSYNAKRFGGRVVEYRGGLEGCKATVLHVLVYSAGGIALDKASNLIVVDKLAARVKVFPPPYRRNERRLGSQYNIPINVRLNRSNTLAFVTDAGKETVYVIDYPTGRIVKKLDQFNAGFTIPFDAVDGPNAVY